MQVFNDLVVYKYGKVLYIVILMIGIVKDDKMVNKFQVLFFLMVVVFVVEGWRNVVILFCNDIRIIR